MIRKIYLKGDTADGMKQITIKGARHDAGFTQSDIAEKMGVTVSAVSRWESGETEMSASQFALFCEIVDRSRDDILLRNKLCLTQ